MSPLSRTLLFDRLRDAVVVVDRDGLIAYVNPALSELLGWAAGDLLGQPLARIIPKRLQQLHSLAFVSFASGSLPLSGKPAHISVLAHDGSEIDAEVSFSALDANLMAVVIRDLRERAEVERELRVTHYLKVGLKAATAMAGIDRADRLAALMAERLVGDFDAAGAVIQHTDADEAHLLVAASSGAVPETMAAGPIGIASSEHVSAQVARSGSPYFSNDPQRDRFLPATWAEQHAVRSHAVLPLAHGDRTLGVLTYYGHSPLPAELGEALRGFALLYASSLRDVQRLERMRADRDAAEAARQRSEFLAQAQALLASSLNYEKTLASLAKLAVPQLADWCAVHVFDADGEPRELAVAHTDPERVRFVRELQQRYPPQPQSEPQTPEAKAYADMIAAGQPILVGEVSTEMLRAGAQDDEHAAMLEQLQLRSMIMVPLAARGRTIGIITLAQAESGRTYTEADLAFAIDLAARAALAIDNARLYSESTAAVRARDEFLSLASHELRTPVTVVLAAAQLLQRLTQSAQPAADGSVSLDGERLKTRAGMVAEGAVRMQGMIDRLLDVTRLQRGLLDIESESVDMGDLAQQAMNTAKAQIAQGRYPSDLALQATLPEESLPVMGDPVRLAQVLDNLLDNALKYTSAGGRVGLRLGRRADRIRVEVTDTGIGIEPEEHERIFQPFGRASNARDANYPGFGMGLAMCKNIIELHGGSIGVESAVGVGSTFWFELPANAGPEHGDEPSATATD